MIRKFLLSLLVLSTLLAMPLGLAHAKTQVEDPTTWGEQAPGIYYKKFDLNDPRPIDVFVAAMDREELSATIDTGIAQGRLSGGVETVKSMAARYDQAINYWDSTWGNRNQVVVAINGYFFGGNREPSGVPWSGQIHSGWYAKRFTECNVAANAGFAWTLDRQAFIADCVFHTPNKNEVKFVDADWSPNIQAINVARDEEDFILYTPQFDATTKTESTDDEPVLEIVVELTRPSLLISEPAKVVGHVRQIRDERGSTPIRFDYVVLSMWGEVRVAAINRINSGLIEVGDEVHINQEITDGVSSIQNDWTKTYASMGGDYHFLNDGIIRTDFDNTDAAVSNARTAIVYNDEWVFFIVVDGKNPSVSEGMNIAELGQFSLDVLGATWGVTLDSGGSSTMVVHGQVVNNTHCNFTDCRNQVDELGDPAVDPAAAMVAKVEAATGRTPQFLLNVSNPPEFELGTISPDDPAAPLVEATVANSMLMVSVQPLAQSSTYTETQEVATTATAAIRLGPGTNYFPLSNISQGAVGEVAYHANDLNGVLAKKDDGIDNWWLVDFGELAGWVNEDVLRALGPGFTPTDFQYLPNIHNDYPNP